MKASRVPQPYDVTVTMTGKEACELHKVLFTGVSYIGYIADPKPLGKLLEALKAVV